MAFRDTYITKHLKNCLNASRDETQVKKAEASMRADKLKWREENCKTCYRQLVNNKDIVDGVLSRI